MGEPPVAIVESPSLVSRRDQAGIPHMYPAADRWPAHPCLYYPDDGDWAADRPLATTIVPWLLEWLLHYEVWLTTGEWRGGGVEHGPTSGSALPEPAPNAATSLGSVPAL